MTNLRNRLSRAGMGRFWWGFLLLLVVLALVARPVSAEGVGELEALEGGAIVRCDPPTITAGVGEVFFVDLYVQDVVDLYAIDIEATYNPAIATVNDSGGAPGTQMEPIYTFLNHGLILFNIADNGTGDLHFASTQFFPSLPVSGSGSIVRVHFTGVTDGSFPIVFTRSDMSDINGGAIPNTTQNCLVTVGDPTAIVLQTAEANGKGSDLVGLAGFVVVLMAAVTVFGIRSARFSARPK